MFDLKRFQVNKRVEAALKKNHPWIFKNQCSTALGGLKIGSLVRLLGPTNNFLGIGIYEPLGAIAIRVFQWEDILIDEKYFFRKLLKAHNKRLKYLASYNTNAYRLIHGEADGFPGLTIDIFDKTAIVVFYLKSWKEILKNILEKELMEIGIEKIYVKEPHGNGGEGDITKPIQFIENSCPFLAWPLSGLKTGFFLDLREVRLALAHLVKEGDTMLNLFANDGNLSVISKSLGAQKVISVEQHETSKTQAQALFDLWEIPFEDKNWITDDVWKYLEKETDEKFDVIILDPPSLSTQKKQKGNLANTWKFLHINSFKRLKPGGKLISISCTERLSKEDQIKYTLESAKTLEQKIKLIQKIGPSFDHPELKSLPERNYFRALVWEIK
ncbi:MAG: hypothetical protein A3G32_02800 [Deltaproteobacteria bacterium RIFCSPLOWO2_12_FULL_40_28]|nr:MAG: hypothetical protein A3C45_00180 [Deltaproteobacteria bacterium RIFCSPHIGHO2_02_FULL_40_28]OGQ20045.1 MAG: hypothetical protein A3E27_02845 [Deltaproteobacteria bacterium RIFCSPHIGHO2_12_FULL_40_32]OGQ40612.1 MAG: hypothetical protein A3I69_10270 [Deltaproteobacteria bacterium RIFCSPLOWO2_02_FULL_40_36]OGQ54281.1 MAG: hypothetical protein A3G32_02800 [Deltaproteobacteria bacterium RIFCSPLOWO2_12_FULL_40_28]